MSRRRSGGPREELELTVAELAAGGEGVAIATVGGERRAIFVAGVAPGDRVRVDADMSRRPARGRVLALLEPSPSRVTPACAFVDACGACDWMHLARDAQLAAHAAVVERALPDAFAGAKVVPHAAPRTLGYRGRTRVHVEARGKRVTVGMFGRRSHEPVPVDTCVVLDPPLEDARRRLGELLAGASGRGEAQLSLSTPAESPRIATLDLRWSGDLPADVFARIDRAVASRTLAGARLFCGEVKKPAIIGDPTPWIAGGDGEPLRLAPGGFAQATEDGNALLVRRVDELARAHVAASALALELYAGSGNLTIVLARTFDVVAVEAERDACEAARANLAARGLRARVALADAKAHAIPSSAKLVVLDPPRAGAKEVARALAARPVPVVIYVSCDPATLGRDLATLADAYALAAVETFELFPQTSHVETVAVLVKRKGKTSERARDR